MHHASEGLRECETRRWCAPVADTASGIVARVAKNVRDARDRGVISFSYTVSFTIYVPSQRRVVLRRDNNGRKTSNGGNALFKRCNLR